MMKYHFGKSLPFLILYCFLKDIMVNCVLLNFKMSIRFVYEWRLTEWLKRQNPKNALGSYRT